MPTPHRLSPPTLLLVLLLASLTAASLQPTPDPAAAAAAALGRRRNRVQQIQRKIRDADDAGFLLRRQISVDPGTTTDPATTTPAPQPAPAPAPVTSNTDTSTQPAPAPAPVTTTTNGGGAITTPVPSTTTGPPIAPSTTSATRTSQSVQIITIISTDSNSNLVTSISSSTSLPTSAPSETSSGSSSKTGLIIAGSVVGGLAALGGLGYALWFFCKKRGYDDGLNEDAIRWPELVRHGSRGGDTLNELNPMAAQRKEGAAGVGMGEDDDDLRSNVGGGGGPGSGLGSVSGTMTMRSQTRSPGPGMMYAGQGGNMSSVPLTAPGPYYDDPRGQGFYDPYAQPVPSPYVYVPGGVPTLPAGYYGGPTPGYDAYGAQAYRPGTPNMSSESGQSGADFARKPSVGAGSALGGEAPRRSPTLGQF